MFKKNTCIHVFCSTSHMYILTHSINTTSIVNNAFILLFCLHFFFPITKESCVPCRDISVNRETNYVASTTL